MDKNLRTSYGTVRNINKNKLKRRTKLKLYKAGIATVAASVLILLGGIKLSNKIQESEILPMPDNQSMITISVRTQYGDTLSDIAGKYYNDDFEGVYQNINNYINAIKKENKVTSDKIKYNINLDIPVIIDSDNQYYQHILELEKEIKDIEKNDLWVEHTIESGDSISYLASLASRNISETYELANKISFKNGIGPKKLLQAGEKILIINPKLGGLKIELEETKKQLEETLVISNKKK